MTLIFFICLGTLLVVLQTTLFMPSPAWAYAPDFFYIFIAYLASRFDVFRGILLVYLVGLMGSGKSEVCKAIFGVQPYDSGEVVFQGRRAVLDPEGRAEGP